MKNKKEILEELKTMEWLILSAPELFHDGINQDLISIIRRIKNKIKEEK